MANTSDTAGTPSRFESSESITLQDIGHIDLFRPTYGNTQLMERFERLRMLSSDHQANQTLPFGSMNDDGITGMQYSDQVFDGNGQLIYLNEVELSAAWNVMPTFRLSWQKIMHHAQQLDFNPVANAEWYQEKLREHSAAMETVQAELTAAVHRRLKIALPMPERDRLRTVAYLRALFSKIRRRFEQELDQRRGRPLRFTIVPGRTYVGDQMLYLYTVLRAAYLTIRPIPDKETKLFHFIFLSTVLMWQREILEQMTQALDNGDQEGQNLAETLPQYGAQPGHNRDVSGVSLGSLADDSAPRKRKPGRPAGSKNKSSSPQQNDESHIDHALGEEEQFSPMIKHDSSSPSQLDQQHAYSHQHSVNEEQVRHDNLVDSRQYLVAMPQHLSYRNDELPRVYSAYPSLQGSDGMTQQDPMQIASRYAVPGIFDRSSFYHHSTEPQWSRGQNIQDGVQEAINHERAWEPIPEDWPMHDRQVLERLNRHT